MTAQQVVTLVLGLAGISGTLAGALGGAYLKARFDRRAEGRKEELAALRPARLIDADLAWAEGAARTCVQKRHWWPSDRKIRSEAWPQYRDVIASRLSFHDWMAVMVAVEAVDNLQDVRDGYRKLQETTMTIDAEMHEVVVAAEQLGLDIADPSPDIPAQIVTRIEPLLLDIQAGRVAVARLVRLPHEQSGSQT